MDNLTVDFSFEWETVLQDTGKEYLFPNPINDFMKQHYRHPAVYRWNIYHNSTADERIVYIGEAKMLLGRLKNYLLPGSRKTSKRLNQELRKYVSQNFTVRLEILKFDRIAVGNFTLTPGDLHEKSVRRFIEELLIIVSGLRKVTLLNL